MPRKYWLAVFAALTLTTGLALAANIAGQPQQRLEPPKTRQEAISRAKENVVRLEKMTDQQWMERHKRLEQRRKAREARQAQRGARRGGLPATTAPAPAMAPAPAAAVPATQNR